MLEAILISIICECFVYNSFCFKTIIFLFYIVDRSVCDTEEILFLAAAAIKKVCDGINSLTIFCKKYATD